MSQPAIEKILDKLRTERSREAWTEFLEIYSDRIYKTAYLATSDADSAVDCYLYICEQLSRKSCKRLLHFQPQGAAKFETWLGVVARNLCFDWMRSRYGRKRTFLSIQNLPPFEKDLFRLHVEQGLSLEETLSQLKSRYPSASARDVQDADARVQQALSPRQRWLLQLHSIEREPVSVVVLGEGGEEGAEVLQPEDPRPSPELELLALEDRRRLNDAVAKLDSDERLFIKLRFEEGLSLAEIARLTGTGDAQRAHYRLNLVLAKLRKFLRE